MAKARRRVVVVGAGPGGLAAVARLRERGAGSLELVLLTPGRRATFLAGTLDVAVGVAEPDRFGGRVALEGVQCVDAAVDRVEADCVLIGDERVDADAVIAAPGLALGTVPAWPRAVAAWDPAGAARARDAMPDVAAGRVLVAALALPYRCPPALFALAVRLAEQHFAARHMTRVLAATPEPFPLAAVGGDAPSLVMESCSAAGVELELGFAADVSASRDGVLCGADGRELRYDAAFLVPPHVRARCLSTLPGEGPMVPVHADGSVDGGTLYVVGDAADTGLPRAAGVATGKGIVAADAVLEALGIAAAPPPGAIEASCFMYHPRGAVSRVRVVADGGGLSVAIDGPSLDLTHAREGERRKFLSAAGVAGGPRAPSTPT
jgi:sulfide:quinone oxidoreductase